MSEKKYTPSQEGIHRAESDVTGQQEGSARGGGEFNRGLDIKWWTESKDKQREFQETIGEFSKKIEEIRTAAEGGEPVVFSNKSVRSDTRVNSQKSLEYTSDGRVVSVDSYQDRNLGIPDPANIENVRVGSWAPPESWISVMEEDWQHEQGARGSRCAVELFKGGTSVTRLEAKVDNYSVSPSDEDEKWDWRLIEKRKLEMLGELIRSIKALEKKEK